MSSAEKQREREADCRSTQRGQLSPLNIEESHIRVEPNGWVGISEAEQMISKKCIFELELGIHTNYKHFKE